MYILLFKLLSNKIISVYVYLFYWSCELFIFFDKPLIFIFVFFWHSCVRVVFRFRFIVRIPDYFDHLKFVHIVFICCNIIFIISYFWNKYQCHGKETTENNRQRYKRKTSILLGCSHHDHWCSYQARNNHIINWHSNVPWIVYLS